MREEGQRTPPPPPVPETPRTTMPSPSAVSVGVNTSQLVDASTEPLAQVVDVYAPPDHTAPEHLRQPVDFDQVPTPLDYYSHAENRIIMRRRERDHAAAQAAAAQAAATRAAAAATMRPAAGSRRVSSASAASSRSHAAGPARPPSPQRPAGRWLRTELHYETGEVVREHHPAFERFAKAAAKGSAHHHDAGQNT